MESGRDTEWRDHVIEARGAVLNGEAPALYRSVNAGLTTRIAPGLYLPSTVWRGLSADDQFRARIDAAAIRFPGEGPFSHLSAAALWGLPSLRSWPMAVEVLAARGTGGRSRRGLRRHGVGIPSVCEIIDGHSVTLLARTVVDASSALPFAGGVAMADFALRASRSDEFGVAARRVARSELDEAIRHQASSRGSALSRAAIEFADGLSGSPGESMSRCAMRASGIPAPELQSRFSDDSGLIGFVDFWWPQWGVIGEFDGLGKYLREEWRGGRSIAEVVVDEKVREDRLRAATGARIVRWGWDVARSSHALAAMLLRAGLPQRRRFS